MRAAFGILLLACFGSALVARADGINAHVRTNSPDGSCYSSETGANAASLSCGSFPLIAEALASADLSGGSFFVLAGAPEYTPDEAVASALFNMNGTYVLTGGVGTAVIDLSVDYPEYFFGNSAALYCSLTIDGVGRACSPAVGDAVLTVDYGVPFSMQVNFGLYALAIGGEETDGHANLALSVPGVLITPEPSSILLLMSGLGGVLFAARSRCKRIDLPYVT